MADILLYDYANRYSRFLRAYSVGVAYTVSGYISLLLLREG